MSTLKDKKILITGGAGFIGAHLAAEISRRGGKVTIVDKALKQDLKKFIQKGGLKKKFDYIFHLAGRASVKASLEDPLGDLRENLESTIYLLEGIKVLDKKPLLIFASSSAVYGIPTKMPISENSPALPVSPYGVSKLGAEHYIRVYHELYGLPAVILRFFSVYGPGQRKQVIYDLMGKIRANPHQLEVLGGSDQMIDLIYIEDLVQAIILVAQKSSGQGEIYNLATGKSTKMSEILRLLFQIYNVKPKIKCLPDARPGANLKWRINISKLKKLGFKPQVRLFPGLREVKKWIEDNE